jgi:hypothetical protein
MDASEGIAATLWQLALQGFALRAVADLRDLGEEPILLKGPVTASWLYDRASEHPYGDIDLLVRPSTFDHLVEALQRRGYLFADGATERLYAQDNATTLRSGNMQLDLHRRLVGVPEQHAARAYEVLLETSVPFTIGGVEVTAMSEPARLFHLALHAAQGSTGLAKALKDLDQGLARFPDLSWRDAQVLAKGLGAEEAMAAGLRRVRRGAVLAAALDMPARLTPELWLRLRGGPEEALALLRVAGVSGWRKKVVLVLEWFKRQDGDVVSAGRKLHLIFRVCAAVPYVTAALASSRLKRRSFRHLGDPVADGAN